MKAHTFETTNQILIKIQYMFILIINITNIYILSKKKYIYELRLKDRANCRGMTIYNLENKIVEINQNVILIMKIIIMLNLNH